MELSAEARMELRRLVSDLVERRYSQIASDGRIGRLTVDELERAVREYGRTLTELPDEGFADSDVIPLDADPSVCAVNIPLWTREEGRSDLTLSLTVRNVAGTVTVEIDDLHVL
jgi:hypothetical protein